ncbi:unnamed protein product [Closterium sp. NIES-53]
MSFAGVAVVAAGRPSQGSGSAPLAFPLPPFSSPARFPPSSASHGAIRAVPRNRESSWNDPHGCTRAPASGSPTHSRSPPLPLFPPPPAPYPASATAPSARYRRYHPPRCRETLGAAEQGAPPPGGSHGSRAPLGAHARAATCAQQPRRR